MNKERLKALIEKSLKNQGFRIRDGSIRPPANLDKDKLRELHSLAVRHRIDVSKNGLMRHETRLLRRFACGSEVDPSQISPRLVEVRSDSEEELLFRYASLHWSIPVSSGYGRRLRFLVIDDHNKKIIGLFGLGDPVFSLAARDNWIAWNADFHRTRLHNVMDAFVLGAVPPYSFLLCGKLIAMLVTSNEVRNAFKIKYGGRESLIRQSRLDGRLALVTTTSALGRSSIYNRIKYDQRLLYHHVGFTQGSGEFQFTNGLYGTISQYVGRYCEATAKQERWGTGFRNRREVVRKCLAKIGLSTEWLYHGIQRKILAVPMARNTREFLKGTHSKLMWYDQSAVELFDFFKDRWLLPRSRRDETYRLWATDQWTLWPPT